ncbi:MAG: hypothetical protein K6G09_06725 [Treponema sp.]|nr:hypothetical protein [Treponema sp.]
MTFNHNGLHFEACEGSLIVSKDGEKVLQAFDVFWKGVPSVAEVIKCYEIMIKISEEK